MKIGAFLLRLERQYAFVVFVVDVVVVHNSLKIAQQKKNEFANEWHGWNMSS